MFLKKSILFFFLLIPVFSFAQDEDLDEEDTIETDRKEYKFAEWDQAMMDKANTAKNADYMTAVEKEVIYLCNLARLNGKLFADTYLKQYLEEGIVEKSTYTGSLIADLRKVKKLEPLLPQKDLFECAKSHAVESGTKGTIGHQNFTKRFKKYASRYVETGENCDYGSNEAIDIVMSLLIDEDVPDKGHRKNILDPTFKSVGVSLQSHKKEDWNCVMDFGDLK